MVHLPHIILVDLFREQRDGVPDEEVGHVQRHLLIHLAVQQLVFNLLVVHQRDVVVPAVCWNSVRTWLGLISLLGSILRPVLFHKQCNTSVVLQHMKNSVMVLYIKFHSLIKIWHGGLGIWYITPFLFAMNLNWMCLRSQVDEVRFITCTVVRSANTASPTWPHTWTGSNPLTHNGTWVLQICHFWGVPDLSPPLYDSPPKKQSHPTDNLRQPGNHGIWARQPWVPAEEGCVWESDAGVKGKYGCVENRLYSGNHLWWALLFSSWN